VGTKVTKYVIVAYNNAACKQNSRLS